MKSRTFCVSDFESIPSNHDKKSRIFEATVMAFEVTKNRNVTKTQSRGGIRFIIKDVLSRDEVNSHPKVRERIAASTIACTKRSDILTLDVSFKEFFDLWNEFIYCNGNTVVTHSWQNDANILMDTQNFLGVKVLKQRYNEFMDSPRGTYNKYHHGIAKLCSQRILTERALRYKKNFHSIVDKGGIPLTFRGYYPSDLESHVKALRNDSSYTQGHNSVQDTLDLMDVLKSAIADDGLDIIGDYSYYYHSPTFELPRRIPSCTV